MNILNKVAKAIAWRELNDKGRKECVWPNEWGDSELKEYRDIAATAIGVFLKAAAKKGWHMAKDEATKEMIIAGGNHDHVGDGYEAMHNAAPEFKWKDDS